MFNLGPGNHNVSLSLKVKGGFWGVGYDEFTSGGFPTGWIIFC